MTLSPMLKDAMRNGYEVSFSEGFRVDTIQITVRKQDFKWSRIIDLAVQRQSNWLSDEDKYIDAAINMGMWEVGEALDRMMGEHDVIVLDEEEK